MKLCSSDNHYTTAPQPSTSTAIYFQFPDFSKSLTEFKFEGNRSIPADATSLCYAISTVRVRSWTVTILAYFAFQKLNVIVGGISQYAL